MLTNIQIRGIVLLTNIQIRGHIIIPILYADKHIFNFDDKHIFNFDDKHTSIRIANPIKLPCNADKHTTIRIACIRYSIDTAFLIYPHVC